MATLSDNVMKFYEIVYRNGLEGGITWFEGEFHSVVTIKNSGEIVSYGQNFNMENSLIECGQGLAKVGIS